MWHRTFNFYALGLSLGGILDITNPIDYIKALSQIMSEFERHTSDDSNKKMVKKDSNNYRTHIDFDGRKTYLERQS